MAVLGVASFVKYLLAGKSRSLQSGTGGGVHDDDGVRNAPAQPRQRFYASELWHLVIEHDDVGSKARCHVDGFASVGRFADDLKAIRPGAASDRSRAR